MGEAKKVVDRLWEMVEGGNTAAMVEVVDADCDVRMPGISFKGVPPLQQMLATYLVAFPNLRHDVKSCVEAGDTIALELEVSGTHSGPWQVPQGTIPATGKKLVWESCDYVRVRNGKIVSWHVYHDTLPFMTALGLIPPAS